MTFAIGTLIGAGGVSFWPVWVGAALGAACGDWLSYWIGQKLEHSVQHIWPLSRHPDLIPRGERFMQRWGVAGIFIGRFFGPLRAAVPLVGRTTGIFAAPEGAATAAAVPLLVARGQLDAAAEIVLFNTGSGLKYVSA